MFNFFSSSIISICPGLTKTMSPGIETFIALKILEKGFFTVPFSSPSPD